MCLKGGGKSLLKNTIRNTMKLILCIVIFSVFDCNIQKKEIGENRLVEIYLGKKNPYNVISDIKNNGGKIVRFIPQIGYIKFSMDQKSIDFIQNEKMIEIEPISFIHGDMVLTRQNNINGNNIEINTKIVQWDMDKVYGRVRPSYNVNTKKKVTVGIIDSGIDLLHPDLKDSIDLNNSINVVPKGGVSGMDMEEDGNVKDINDKFGHGTEVAGQISANGRIKGSYPNVPIRVYRAFDKSGGTNLNWIIKAIIKSVDNGDNIINLSGGSYVSQDSSGFKLWSRTIQYAENHGSLIVSSVGNDSINIDDNQSLNKFFSLKGGRVDSDSIVRDFPAQSDKVVGIGSTNINDEVSSFSNFGDNVTFYEPSGDENNYDDVFDSIVTTTKDGKYAFTKGTSYSAAKAAGIIAAYISYRKDSTYSPSEIRKLLYSKVPQENKILTYRHIIE